jgi:hypothetical protein
VPTYRVLTPIATSYAFGHILAYIDMSLKAQGEHMGICDFEAVDRLAGEQGMVLVLLADHAMPANNRLLVWRRGE